MFQREQEYETWRVRRSMQAVAQNELKPGFQLHAALVTGNVDITRMLTYYVGYVEIPHRTATPAAEKSWPVVWCCILTYCVIFRNVCKGSNDTAYDAYWLLAFGALQVFVSAICIAVDACIFIQLPYIIYVVQEWKSGLTLGRARIITQHISRLYNKCIAINNF